MVKIYHHTTLSMPRSTKYPLPLTFRPADGFKSNITSLLTISRHELQLVDKFDRRDQKG